MKRIVVIVASGLVVAGCASWSVSDLIPSFGPSTAELSLASEPPGAEARTSTGQACRTPCRLTLPLNTGDFTVTFTLPGRIAQVVPVTIRPPDAGTASRFDPNPAYAQLDPAMPPPDQEEGAQAEDDAQDERPAEARHHHHRRRTNRHRRRPGRLPARVSVAAAAAVSDRVRVAGLTPIGPALLDTPAVTPLIAAIWSGA